MYDEVRSGKPRTIDEERVARLIETTLHTNAQRSAHWSLRTVAAETGISKTSMQRYFWLFGLHPHRRELQVVQRPFLHRQAARCGRHVPEPAGPTLVICGDEKSQCRALECTQPIMPVGSGYVEGFTHDYKRHGTTTLCAALTVLNGAVLVACKPRHGNQEFLSTRRVMLIVSWCAASQEALLMTLAASREHDHLRW